MRTIEVPDEIYEKVARNALKEGVSVAALAVEVLDQGLPDEPEGFDHLFTPERIAEWNRIADDMANGGQSYTLEEVGEYLRLKREEWMRKKQG